MVLEILRPGRNTRTVRVLDMGSATYNVLGMARFAHRRCKRNWRSSAKVNPPFDVAVKKIENVSDLGFVGSAGGRHNSETLRMSQPD